ncbi:MAG TPA: hypothetical protein VE397_12675 [Stellaceae bacterium]|nr:hypothetical protein [Stellaceae bacterium]
MDTSFGLGRPASLAAVTLPQSAPGLSTALAEALFQSAPREGGELPVAKVAPRPANDRHAASGFLSGLYRFGLRAVGW